MKTIGISVEKLADHRMFDHKLEKVSMTEMSLQKDSFEELWLLKIGDYISFQSAHYRFQ